MKKLFSILALFSLVSGITLIEHIKHKKVITESNA